MTDRPRLKLPFGGGLDRGTGVVAADPTSFRDVQNLNLYRGRAELRRGWSQTATYAGEDAVLGVFSIRSQGVGAVLTWRAATKEVRLWSVTEDATGPTLIGVVWTLPATYTSLPRIIGADSYDKLFLAHDEVNFVQRQATMVYDPFGAGTITALSLDLDGDGTPATAYFRGVYAYLNYIFAWGYGTESDANRPEIVRNCLPGDPLSWDPNHYFIAGQRGDPVVGLGAIGAGDTAGVLAVQKASESWKIVGYDRNTFGIEPLDGRYGRLGARLGVTVDGVLYAWADEGPRAFATGGASQDLAFNLSLLDPAINAGLDPNSLDYDAAFAAYLPVRREVLFVFGAWAFVLHLADNAPRWSYRAFGVQFQCAGLLYVQTASAPTTAPAAHYEYVADTAHAVMEIDVDFDWVGAIDIAAGDETELWAKPASSGVWSRIAHSAPASDTPPNPSNLAFTPLLQGMNYTLAARIARGGIGAAGYDGLNPDAWNALARTGTQSTTVPKPVIDHAVWLSAVSTRLELSNADSGAWFDYEAQISTDGGTTWTDLVQTAIDRPGQTATFNTTGHDGVPVKFRARLNSSYVGVGAWSDAYDSDAVAPAAPTITSATWARISASHATATLQLTGALTANVTYNAQLSNDGGTTWHDLPSVSQDPATQQLVVYVDGYENAACKFKVQQTAYDYPYLPSGYGPVFDWFVGPPAPTAVTINSVGTPAGDYNLDWTPGGAGDSNDVAAYDSAGSPSAMYVTVTAVTTAIVSVACPVANVTGQIRTRRTTYGVDDFSDWVFTTSIPSNC